MFKHLTRAVVLAIVAAVPVLGGNTVASPRSKPNVILILVDDMGYMDSSVYGSKYYETPSLERLASRSVVFTNAYAASPQCSPTRASILTGKYPARLRLTRVFKHYEELGREPGLIEGPPTAKLMTVESRRALPLAENTIGEALKELGYVTGFIGKWHLGREEKYWPEHQGFDTNVAGIGRPGPGGYFDPYSNPRLTPRKRGEYVTDRLTSEALTFLEGHRDRPFFLCLWHFAAHAPWGHKEEITQRFRAKVDPRGRQGNPVLASMIFSVDQGLGRVLDKLDELEIADETIVIFTSDNGGNVNSLVDGIPATNNAPLRGGKGTIYEGGLRVPLIIRLPGMRSQRRSVDPVMSIDFYPTILELAGGTPNVGATVDGVSLAPVLSDAGLEREAIYWHFPHVSPKKGNTPNSAVRRGRWKLIRFYGQGEGRGNRFELYDLWEDEGEATDLAAQEPELVTELDLLLGRHLRDCDALIPLPNPAYESDDTREGEAL